MATGTYESDKIKSPISLWPGNTRELANVIEHAIVMMPTDEIRSAQVISRKPEPARSAGEKATLAVPFKNGRQRVIAEYETAYLTECLRQHRGNINLCARACGVDIKTLYRKMQEYGLEKRSFRKS